MNSIHRPDPEFVDNLERELRSTIRRQGRFDNRPPARTSMVSKLRGTTALVALAAMCIGSAGTLAVTQQLHGQAADLLIAKSEAQLEFANARREVFLEKLHETESRATAGVLTLREVDSMRLEYAQVETDAEARACDVAEARITGREPDNSLSAPIVRGRDFVTERLVLQQDLLFKTVSMIDGQMSSRKLNPNEPAATVREPEAARKALSAVEDRLALRRDYLSGARTARQVELADMQSSVQSQQELAISRVHELQPKLDRIHTLVEEGMATRSEARPVEMEFRAARLALELAELDMQILESKLADRAGQ